jgi:hypothetical protein
MQPSRRLLVRILSLREVKVSTKLARAWTWCRRNPVTCVVFLFGAVAGSVSAVVFQVGPEEMATWKRAVGGAFAGAWLAMFPLGFRLFE